MLKLSVSSMDTYNSCAKKYFYRYVEKLDIEKVKWPWTEFGSCAHLILEYFHNEANQDTPQEEWPKIMKKCFVKAVKEFALEDINADQGTPDGKTRRGIPYLKDIIQNYLDVLREEGMPEVIGNEIPYSFKMRDDVIVRGYIDRVDRVNDTTIRVVDYKTSKNGKYLKEFQLLVYAVALKQQYPGIECVEGEFVLLKNNCKRIKYTFRDFDIERCYDLIQDNLEKIETDTTWKKKPGFLCKFCDYEKVCLGRNTSDIVKHGEEKWV